MNRATREFLVVAAVAAGLYWLAKKYAAPQTQTTVNPAGSKDGNNPANIGSNDPY